jgi:S-adenosylmethionine:tRNA ribosyltransferase-isomerase
MAASGERRRRTEEFDYPLPHEAIAADPVEPRSAARLMVAIDPAQPVAHRRVADLPELLGPGDVIVVNETRVLAARLELTKSTGGLAEVLLLEPIETPSSEPGTLQRWEALVRPARRLPPGTRLYPRRVAAPAGALPGEPIAPGSPVVLVGERLGGARREVTLLDPDAIATYGVVPIPPYLDHLPADPERYQTVYSRYLGSVAAPTAGLHFDQALLAACRAAGATIAAVDLSVGLGTFQKVDVPFVEDHVLHEERYRVPAATLEACRSARRVLAVGTTSMRALETVAAGGPLEGRTSLYIHGDYPFQLVDLLLTNFHLPRSSLLVLIEAFCGPRWRELYAVALASGYRFASFGDAMLLGRG